jgi:hypothetical protein
MVVPFAYLGVLWCVVGDDAFGYAILNPIFMGLAVTAFFAGGFLWSWLPNDLEKDRQKSREK